jgi:drug/metabolite transporter (DMT)-like permease
LSANYKFLFLTLSVLLQPLAFLLLKFASDSQLILKYFLFSTAVFFVLFRAFCWQKSLHNYSLNKIYPLTIVSQCVIVFFGVVLFKESLMPIQYFGIVFMFFGVYQCSR